MMISREINIHQFPDKNKFRERFSNGFPSQIGTNVRIEVGIVCHYILTQIVAPDVIISAGKFHFLFFKRIIIPIDPQDIITELLIYLIVHPASLLELLQLVAPHLVTHPAQSTAEFPEIMNLPNLLPGRIFNHAGRCNSVGKRENREGQFMIFS